jgi:hypothetical protein
MAMDVVGQLEGIPSSKVSTTARLVPSEYVPNLSATDTLVGRVGCRLIWQLFQLFFFFFFKSWLEAHVLNEKATEVEGNQKFPEPRPRRILDSTYRRDVQCRICIVTEPILELICLQKVSMIWNGGSGGSQIFIHEPPR